MLPRRRAPPIVIDAELDGGAIYVVRATNPLAIELALRPDSAAPELMQWFHFRARGVAGCRCRYRIANAGLATYADAFEGYRVCASYDGDTWFRVPTSFDGRSLVFRHTPSEDEVLYAYFAAYPEARRRGLLARADLAPRVRIERLGETPLGRPMEVVIVGEEGPTQRRVWICARQHPGETAAEWFAEGALSQLLDRDDPTIEALLDQAVIYLVPCVNPDGAALGNQRTNALGCDLNRSWDAPDPAHAPEVFLVRRAMLEGGVDLFLDIHADERKPFCFAAGCEGNPGYSSRIFEQEERFLDVLLDESDDFQREEGYERDAPGEGDLSTAGNWVGERFDCLSLTLEMPFKDEALHPDLAQGWSPERAARLGRATLGTLARCLPGIDRGD